MNKQAFGYIIKKEQLESLSDYSEHKAMLLIASNPFPGYTGIVNKDYYYLVLDSNKQKSIEELIRLIQTIRKKFSINIDICSSEITVYNKLYQSIRIYSKNLDYVQELISYFQLYGVSFHNSQLVKSYISQIKVFKFFELQELTEGVFKSLDSPDFKYIQIPDKIDWAEFENLVIKANSSENFSNCDFAIASLYSKDGIDDYIRVFSSSCTPNRILPFKDFIYSTLQQHIIK